jgi:hypothetical protein
MGVGVAEHPSGAVGVEDDGERPFGALGTHDADRDLAGRTLGDSPVLDVDVRAVGLF